jgi:hypothetical protein
LQVLLPQSLSQHTFGLPEQKPEKHSQLLLQGTPRRYPEVHRSASLQRPLAPVFSSKHIAFMPLKRHS